MGGHGLKKQRHTAHKRARRRAGRETGSPTQGKRGALLREAQRVATCPVHECLVTGAISDLGMGNVFLARRFPGSQIGLAVFLVDLYCLGVKDAMFVVVSRDAYAARIDMMRVKEKLEPIDPCCARKLIEGSVAYAKRLGFVPHSDYILARPLIAEVDIEACETEFEYGESGKPFYVAGPNDSPVRVRRIMNTLTNSVGRDGFHFMVSVECQRSSKSAGI